MIADADLVTRADACRALRPVQISRSSPVELINYVVAADAAWITFCGGDK
jgi:hypothetical protein